MDSVQRELVRALEQESLAAVATVVRTVGSSPREMGTKMIVYADGRRVGTIGGGEMEDRVAREAQAAIREGKPRYLDFSRDKHDENSGMSCAGEMDIYVEPLVTTPTLFIVGAGHVGAACAELGKFLGYNVIVVDDRPDFLSRERFPTADELRSGELLREIQRADINTQTYVVLATRAHALDADLLCALLESHAPFIGLLSNDRRAAAVFRELGERGVNQDVLRKLRAPVGMEIEAETPQEIAVSIMAQIIAVRRKAWID